MDIEDIKKYKVAEDKVLTEADKKHIENYRQLIKFFENAITNSIKKGNIDYNSLHASCLQSVRFLDNLIYSYESAIQGARMINSTLDKIVSDNQNSAEGNEEEYVSPL